MIAPNFSSLKELINYCKLCSFCGKQRKLTFDVGPDTPSSSLNFSDYIKLGDFSFNKNVLILNVISKVDNIILNIPYTIYFSNNTFEMGDFSVILNPDGKEVNEEILPAELYLWLSGNCKHCQSLVATKDIYFNFQKKCIYDFEHLDSEEFILNDFVIDLNYPDVIKVWHRAPLTKNFKHIKGIGSFKISDFDLSDKNKLLEQLEIFRLFS